MKRKLSVAAIFAAAAMLAWSASAGAVDGTIEINDAKVKAAGGYPFAISGHGSYRLTSNLKPPASTDGIDVSASNVTIDLNGFAIIGPAAQVSHPTELVRQGPTTSRSKTGRSPDSASRSTSEISASSETYMPT